MRKIMAVTTVLDIRPESGTRLTPHRWTSVSSPLFVLLTLTLVLVSAPDHVAADWTTDVQIGARDSIQAIELEVDQSTGNLFAVVALDGESISPPWVAYHSSDSGYSWSETYVHSGFNPINSISCAYWDDYFYVAISGGSDLLLFRFRSSDGQQADFPTGAYVTIGSFNAQDIVMTATPSGGEPSYMYLVSRSSVDNAVSISFADLNDLTSWTQDHLSYWEADRGLDAVASTRPSYPLHISCVNNNREIRIVAYDPALGWSEVHSRAVFSTSPDMTSISANGTWIGCAYEYFIDPRSVLFCWNSDDGSPWWEANIHPSDDHAHSPALSCGSDGGIGLAYLHTRSNSPYLTTSQFKWKPYDSSVAFPGISPGAYADHEVTSAVQADLEYLGGGQYGLAYVTTTNQAFFTRSYTVACCNLRTDVDHNGDGPDIADLIYMVTYMFQDGPAPPCDEPYLPECYEHYFAEADIDGDGSCMPDIADLIYLVGYMFQEGPEPAPCP